MIRPPNNAKKPDIFKLLARQGLQKFPVLQTRLTTFVLVVMNIIKLVKSLIMVLVILVAENINNAKRIHPAPVRKKMPVLLTSVKMVGNSAIPAALMTLLLELAATYAMDIPIPKIISQTAM